MGQGGGKLGVHPTGQSTVEGSEFFPGIVLDSLT